MVMQRLRNLREDSDLTQVQMGKMLNITQKAYSNYETGQRSIPLDVLIKLAKYFDTSTDYLLEVIDDKRSYANLVKYYDKIQ